MKLWGDFNLLQNSHEEVDFPFQVSGRNVWITRLPLSDISLLSLCFTLLNFRSSIWSDILFLHPLMKDYQNCSSSVCQWCYELIMQQLLMISHYVWTSSIIIGVMGSASGCFIWHWTVTEWTQDCWKEFQWPVWVTQLNYNGDVLSAVSSLS